MVLISDVCRKNAHVFHFILGVCAPEKTRATSASPDATSRNLRFPDAISMEAGVNLNVVFFFPEAEEIHPGTTTAFHAKGNKSMPRCCVMDQWKAVAYLRVGKVVWEPSCSHIMGNMTSGKVSSFPKESKGFLFQGKLHEDAGKPEK